MGIAFYKGFRSLIRQLSVMTRRNERWQDTAVVSQSGGPGRVM